MPNAKIPAFIEAPVHHTRLWQAGLRTGAGKSQMNAKVQIKKFCYLSFGFVLILEVWHLTFYC